MVILEPRPARRKATNDARPELKAGKFATWGVPPGDTQVHHKHDGGTGKSSRGTIITLKGEEAL
jgi:hypothetical protein